MLKRCLVSLIIVFLFFPLTILYGQSDTLVTNNGNLIVGEIKGMNKGVLKMKTGYSDTDFFIKWGKVKKLYTKTEFLILTTAGGRYDGNLRSSVKNEVVVLSQTDTLAMADIVYLRTVKSDFWSKLSASIGLGYNFTKSNNFRQFSLRSTLGYTATKWSANANFNSISSNRDDVDAVKRVDAALAYRYYLKNDWFPLVEFNWLSNTEQNINLRTVTKLGMGKYLARTNQMYWGMQAGVSYNNESFTDAEVGSQNSAEGFLGSELNLYDIGDLSLLANIIAYPGITESGRWRIDGTVDLQYDLPLDFFVKLGVTVNYDNQSVVLDSNYDYVIQTTFGWKL